MPYIPEGHQQYDLLPRCRKRGGEVFEYPGKLLDQIEILIGSTALFPYGFDSYETYFDTLDIVLQDHGSNKIIHEKLILLKTQMRDLNRKEEWSVVRYKGPAGNSISGLTPGKIYYWHQFYIIRAPSEAYSPDRRKQILFHLLKYLQQNNVDNNILFQKS